MSNTLQAESQGSAVETPSAAPPSAARGQGAVQFKHALRAAPGLGVQMRMLDAGAGAPVQREAAPDAGTLDRVQGAFEGGGGGPAVQRKAVQREETTPPAPAAAGANAAPASANAAATTNAAPPGGGGDAAAAAPTPAAPPFTGPRTYEAYVTHVQGKFGGQLAELATLAADLKAKGGDAKRQEQKLVGDAAALQAKKAEYEAQKDTLDKKKKRAMEGEVAALQGAVDNDGATMPALLAKAQQLVAQIQQGGTAAVALKRELEGVMQASMALSGQIDPEGLGKGRVLYNKIDKEENPALIQQAVTAQLPSAEQAQLAVDYRNWLRTFFRDVVMRDQNAVEILYLRDQGITGQRTGMTIEQVMTKVIGDLKKTTSEATGEALLRNDFTLGTATPAELEQIYAGVIGSARQTNAGVNNTATGNTEGAGGGGAGAPPTTPATPGAPPASNAGGGSAAAGGAPPASGAPPAR